MPDALEIQERLNNLEYLKGLLSRARRVHRMVKNPGPPPHVLNPRRAMPQAERYAWHSTHLLRFMLWVGRSGIPGMRSDIFNIGPHTVKMSVDYWIARRHVGFTGKTIEPGTCHYEGIVIVCPPGHGKTQFATHAMAMVFCEDADEQALMGHAQKEKAIQNLEYVKSCFQTEHANGRRCRALFPKARLSKHGNVAGKMQMITSKKLREASISASGTASKISGADASFILLDDPVDQSEAHSETERDKKYLRLVGTWFPRIRGNVGFKMIVTTLWHEDDANCRIIKQAQAGDSSMAVSIQGCGGPKENFRPLHAPLADSRRLRSAYKQDAHIYACAYMANPSSTGRKIIESVRFFDMNSPEQAQFASQCETWLSCDPSATSHSKSDMAGVVWLGLGDVIWHDEDENGRPIICRERRMRVLWAGEIRANQNELVRAVADFVQTRHADAIYIESRGAFHATADMLDEFYGIESFKLDPGPKDGKATRLRQCASVLDDSMADMGGPRAVFEFPGVRNESGELVCHPDYQWLVDQFTKFGTIKGDHCVDAITQVIPLADLRPGRGADRGESTVRTQVVVDSDLKRLYESIERSRAEKARGRDAHEQDVAFLVQGDMR